MTDETVGQRVRRLREQRGLSQVALAEALGWSRAHISKVETSGDDPGLRLIVAISDFFGVSIDWLARGDDARLGAIPANEEEMRVLLRVHGLTAEQRQGLMQLIGPPKPEAA